MKNRRNLQGFTLIEILIVIGLIAILAAITIIALNPASNFASARNSERQSEMAQIANSIDRWVIEGGSLTGLVPTACDANPVTNPTGKAVTTTNAPFATIFPAGENTIPNDPATGNPKYLICGNANSYTLMAPQIDGTRVTLTR